MMYILSYIKILATLLKFKATYHILKLYENFLSSYLGHITFKFKLIVMS